MKLLYQTHSPFARKVLVFAHEVGLAGDILVEHHETSPTRANADVFEANPLGKVPVLLRDGADPLFDSDVICAWLDTRHAGPPRIPRDGETRWRALRLQAVAQGLADAGIALRWETVRRPEALRHAGLAEGYARKLEATCAWLEQTLDPGDGDTPDIGHIALATTLDWLAFRGLPSFRRHVRLTRWFDAFRGRASMRATTLHGDTVD